MVLTRGGSLSRRRMGDCVGAKRSAGTKHESHAKPSIYDFGYLSAAARSPGETKRSGAISKEIQWFLGRRSMGPGSEAQKSPGLGCYNRRGSWQGLSLKR